MNRICAVIPVHNRVQELTEALRSIDQQTLRCHEVIIVDDCSTLDITPAVTPFRNLPIQIIRHASQRGAAAARNTGARAASSEWLAFLDSDDVWLPDKLQHQLRHLAASDLNASCTGFELVRGPHRSRRHVRPERAGRLRMLTGANIAPGSTLMVDRTAFLGMGGFDEHLRRLEDWDWLLRWSADASLLLIDQALATVHVGEAPDPATVSRSLDQIAAKHGDCSKREQWVLHRTLQLERSAVLLRAGQRRRATGTALLAVVGFPPLLRRVLARLRG